MLNFTLQERSALQGASFDYPGLSIREMPDMKLLSVAASAAQRQSASDALQKHCGTSWPTVGNSTRSDNVQALGLQAEQIFLLSQHQASEHRALANDIAQSAIVTDQSDSWVCIEVTGENKYAVLERICPINLHESTFIDGAVARTVMEHLSVIIVRRDDTFLLFSARSYAESLLHALMLSADYAIQT